MGAQWNYKVLDLDGLDMTLNEALVMLQYEYSAASKELEGYSGTFGEALDISYIDGYLSPVESEQYLRSSVVGVLNTIHACKLSDGTWALGGWMRA